jgi:antitoxin component of MazEF toxin-antitoxin module
MKRKVVKQGHNAMTITLPAAWIKDNNIRCGDELDVDIKGKDLFIKTNPAEGTERITFHMNGTGKYLHRHLGVLYRLGYDEIRVEFDSPLMIDKIQYEIEEMLGFEIVDQGENYCVIKNIASGLEKEFDNILRKIFLNIIHCGTEGLNLIKKGDLKRLENLKQFSRVNNRQPNFCQRLLRKEGYKDYKKTMLVYTMVWNLEQVADYYNNIFKYILSLNKNPKINKEVLELYASVNKLFESYYETFYSFDSNKVSNLKEKCLNIINNIKDKIEKRNAEEIVILLNLNLISERIYHMTECLI